jgi:hypothetical protein
MMYYYLYKSNLRFIFELFVSSKITSATLLCVFLLSIPTISMAQPPSNDCTAALDTELAALEAKGKEPVTAEELAKILRAAMTCMDNMQAEAAGTLRVVHGAPRPQFEGAQK